MARMRSGRTNESSASASSSLKYEPSMKIGFAYDTVAVTPPDFVSPDSAGLMERRVLMRSVGGGWCVPMLFVDGSYFSELDANGLDSFVRPERIYAMEIYDEVTVPLAFRRTFRGCGAVVIWTK